MIPYQNFELYVSISFFVVIKIVSAIVQKHRASMYEKTENLTSIPENNEAEDEIVKWVPKKKHEVLKAKYKCLKKLFQIYDASVVGMLPNTCATYADVSAYEAPRVRHRRKRSHRTKTDACAGTTETSSGDVSCSVIKDLNSNQYCTEGSDTTISKSPKNAKADKSTQDSNDVANNERENESVQTSECHALPYLFYERRKQTRFQNFIYRIFGISNQGRWNLSQGERGYAASDNNISNRYEKRRRRGLRFRRRRPKKIHSEFTLRNLKSPVILSYVQAIQKNYLMDTVPRQCPILGCRMIFNGIINYNDHLNLCHFTDRKYICHYCHEGFSREYDKAVHENEHLGISKLTKNSPIAERSIKIASNTQTDSVDTKLNVPDDKLKKMVSFFDKISDPDEVIGQMKKKIYSDSNIGSLQRSSNSRTTEVEDSKSSGSGKRAERCANVPNPSRKLSSSADSEVTSNFSGGNRVTCRFCGENFNFRRQLSLHMDLEHRVHDRFSKFHSCPGIVSGNTAGVVSEDGKVYVESIGPVTSQSTCTEVSRRKSEATCDPSTNIILYTSAESVLKKPSAVESFVQKIRSYKWEPGSKVIRV